MDFKNELRNTVNYLKKATGKTQAELSKMAGYEDENTITQAISRSDGHEAVLKRLKREFKEILKNTTLTAPETESEKRIENNNKEPVSANMEFPAMEALLKLATANEKLADANQRQTKMLEISFATASASKERPQDVDAIYRGFQEFVRDMETGKKFLSWEEAFAALMSKLVPDEVKRKAARSIPNN